MFSDPPSKQKGHESVSQIKPPHTTFGLKMMMKSGLNFIILKIEQAPS